MSLNDHIHQQETPNDREPFNLGGYLPQGQVYVAPVGTEAVLTDWQWGLVGHLATLRPEDVSLKHRTARTVSRSMTFQQLPPKTRRQKRQRLAFMRFICGRPLPKPTERRQLIHNGGKP